jgi:hypothetical protein
MKTTTRPGAGADLAGLLEEAAGYLDALACAAADQGEAGRQVLAQQLCPLVAELGKVAAAEVSKAE